MFAAWSAGLGRVKAEPPPKSGFVLEGAVELAFVVLLLPESGFEVEGVALVVPLPLPPKVGFEVEAGVAPPPNMLDAAVDAAELPKSPPAVPVFGALEPNNPPVLAGFGAPKILLVAAQVIQQIHEIDKAKVSHLLVRRIYLYLQGLTLWRRCQSFLVLMN